MNTDTTNKLLTAEIVHEACHGFMTGFKFQFVAMKGRADGYFALIASPFFTLIFLSIMTYSGRSDLNSHAVVAPMLMALWTTALSFAGEMISEDRENGRLEMLIAAPTSFPFLIFGRLCTCMLIAIPSLFLSYLTAGFAFGYWMNIPHLGTFTLAMLLTCLATGATATALSAVFVAAPGARIVQNTLSFPMFLLGGVLVPVALLPVWIQPISKILYMSWSADLLRAATHPTPIPHLALHISMILGLTFAALAFGSWFITRFVRQARELGTLAQD